MKSARALKLQLKINDELNKRCLLLESSLRARIADLATVNKNLDHVHYNELCREKEAWQARVDRGEAEVRRLNVLIGEAAKKFGGASEKSFTMEFKFPGNLEAAWTPTDDPTSQLQERSAMPPGAANPEPSTASTPRSKAKSSRRGKISSKSAGGRTSPTK